MKKTFTHKQLMGPDKIVPVYYGIAYEDFFTRSVTFYPVPINLIIRYARELWLIIRQPPQTKQEKREEGIYRNGYLDGLKQGKRR